MLTAILSRTVHCYPSTICSLLSYHNPGMSTVRAAAELVEQIASAIDGQSCCAGVFIDLKNAYDTVDHDLRVEKLHVYGIRGVANKWLQNYLTNRKQYVVIDGQSSDLLDMAVWGLSTYVV